MNASSALAVLWLTFSRYRWHILALIVFGFLSALLEGIGINAVIPLISFFIGPSTGPANALTQAMQTAFSFFNFPFNFRFLLGFILTLFILRAVSMVAFGYIRGWIGADFLGKESEDVLGRTLLSSWPFLLKQKIGTMHNTLVRDIQCTSNLLGYVAQTVQSFTGFLMYFLVAVTISPAMTLYTLGGGALVLLVGRSLLIRIRRISEQASGVEKQFSQFLTEYIIGMKSIKAAGAEQTALADGTGHIHELRSLSIRQSLVRSMSSSLFQPASLVLVVLLFLLTYHTPTFNIISFAASLYLIQKIFTYLESGQNALLSVGEMLPYAQNISNFKKMLSEHGEQLKQDGKPFVFNNSLTFENLSFSYDESQQVLNDVSFSIARGETVGIVGPSGAGKTSVTDIILRLFRPAEGRLLLDGVPSDDMGLEEWRQHIGYVAQDVFLLNGSIEENIRFYRSELTKEDIERATKQANIYDFIMGLPEGFKTTTGDRGVMLSGGQRQRIALARALADNPAILILDEATSALDHESEKLIHESIKTLHGKVTVLIVAHRPSTVAEADRILVLDRGRLVEQGTPNELLKNNTSYFYKMQNA